MTQRGDFDAPALDAAARDLRDKLTAAMAAQHSCDTLLTIPFCNRCRQAADALLSVVQAAQREAAADALETAAEELRQRGVGPEVFLVDDMASALRAGGETPTVDDEDERPLDDSDIGWPW